jgi:ubiquinone/menaquinone biosynthesis C-methylase UbiE
MTPAAPADAPRDPYAEYTRRFFKKWLPVYDLFAWSIFPVYGAALRQVAPGPGLAVLDVCTGTGEMALRCARRGARVTAVDFSEEMLARARAKAARRGLVVDFRAMDARHLDFPDASFDVVLLSLALHDMPRQVRIAVLHQVRRVARGRIVILDYEIRGPHRLRAWLIRGIRLFETAYFERFAREDVASLLARADLGEIEVRRPFPPLFAVWTARP